MKNYLSLIKFSHTIFALPFAMIGFFLAINRQAQGIDWERFVLVVLCMVFARSAAMAFNRYIDRDIDKQNPRTARREIPAGVIAPRNALFFALVNCIAFVTCTYFINALCLALSPVALAVILGYSYTKRFTAWCHFVLGIGLALAPIGAYIAVTGIFDLLPLLYSFAVLFWVAGFDIIYALQDEDFDRDWGLNSIPVYMGRVQALRLSNVLHLIVTALIVYAGIVGPFGWLYVLGASFFILLLIYQHFLVQPHDLSRLNLAFFVTNGISSAIFGAFVLADLFF